MKENANKIAVCSKNALSEKLVRAFSEKLVRAFSAKLVKGVFFFGKAG